MWKLAKLMMVTLILGAAFVTPSYSEWPSCDSCVNWCQQTYPGQLADCLCNNCPECAISWC